MLTSDTEDAPLGCSGDSLVNEEMKTTSEQQERLMGGWLDQEVYHFSKVSSGFNRGYSVKYCIILHQAALEKKNALAKALRLRDATIKKRGMIQRG